MFSTVLMKSIMTYRKQYKPDNKAVALPAFIMAGIVSAKVLLF